MLAPAPKKIEIFHEIATRYDETIVELFNSLTPEERIFIYYIFRASLPGNRIASGQLHRHAHDLIELFELLFETVEGLGEYITGIDLDEFNKQIKTYLIYLWTNHSHYFSKEHVENKRTPEKLQLDLLTYENLKKAATALGVANQLDALKEVIFNASYEPTLVIENEIEASAVNMYAPGIKQQSFDDLPGDARGHLNAYYDLEVDAEGKESVITRRYKIGDVFSDELEVSAHWLQKAYEHAAAHPEVFDQHIVKSLAYLIDYITTGDEELFKKHSVEWTKTKSRIDYLFGFIENYKDPKSAIGMFEAEVTVKTVNLDALNEVLPSVEKQLPFPHEHQRENLDDTDALPNASINTILFGSGDCGPLSITAAYCLPNYPEIRSQHGSKQIMYAPSKGLGELLNPDLSRNLFNTKKDAAWLKEHDNDGKLARDIWEIHCILHETLGHGSGRLAHHTFKEGESLSIDGVNYKVGDSIPVTSKNMKIFLAGMIDALEELRAEIIALYTSIFNFDELHAKGLYKDWPDKIGKEKLIETLIIDMAWTGLRRLISQPVGIKEISGAHARANTAILNYLIDAGGIEIVKETFAHEGKEYTVLGIELKDKDKALAAIKELCIEVQRIKSTADTVSCKELFERYGNFVRDLDHGRILHENQKAVIGNLKVSSRIFPKFELIIKDGVVIDTAGSWPEDIVEQFQYYKSLMMSKE